MSQASMPLEALIGQIGESEKDLNAQTAAVRALRYRLFQSDDVERLARIAEDVDAPKAMRTGALQVLGFHRFCLKIDLMQDDKVQNLPARLSTLIAGTSQERSVRESAIRAMGTQFVQDEGLVETVLADPDPYLRLEALFLLLRESGTNAVESVISHMTTESDATVRGTVLRGLARHPGFIETALSISSQTGGAYYLETIHQACEMDPQGATRSLLAADIKYFDAREALIRRLYQDLDPARITCLFNFMKEGVHLFAVRLLRNVGEDVVTEVIDSLKTNVETGTDEAWVAEATKLSLHYYDRFESHRPRILSLLEGWRDLSPRVSRLALGHDIFWKE